MHLMRHQTTVRVSVSSTQLLGPNPRRRSVVVSAPPSNLDRGRFVNVVADNADTNTVSTKLEYGCPAGRRARVLMASHRINTGAPTLQLRIQKGAETIVISQFTTAGATAVVPGLEAGDILRYVCAVAGGSGSNVDFLISVEEWELSNRLFLSWSTPASINNGIVIHPGSAPLILTGAEFG